MGFRSQFESLVRFRERWGDRVDVYMVYGKEAFPAESDWPAPVPDGGPVSTPGDLEQRLRLVERFADGIGAQLSFLVDDLEDTLMESYDAYPFRVYGIDREGRIAVPSLKGAAGFATTLERIGTWLEETEAGAPTAP